MRFSDALEVAIGLSFIFFVASLVLTSAREAIETVLKLRGAMLFDGIVEMLHDPHLQHEGEALAKRFQTSILSPGGLAHRMAADVRARLESGEDTIAAAHGVAQELLVTATEMPAGDVSWRISLAGSIAHALGGKTSPKVVARAAEKAVADSLHATSAGKMFNNGHELALQLYRHPLISSLMKGSVDNLPFTPRAVFSANAQGGTLPGHITPLALAGNRLDSWWKKRRLPSYLPSRNIALALMGQTMAGKFALVPMEGQGFVAAAALPAVQQLRLLAQSIENAQLRHVMVYAIDTADGDFDRVRQNLEAWFDSAMDRVTGYYKRFTQYIVFGLGLALAVLMNVNTVTIADALFESPTMRIALTNNDTLTKAITGCPAPGVADASENPDSSNTRTTGNADDAQTKAVTCAHDKLLAQVAAADIPIGWDTAAQEALFKPLRQLKALRGTIGVSGYAYSFNLAPVLAWGQITSGWLLTAFAVSLGAPFWFGILNRLMMLRNSLKPGDTDEGSINAPPAPGLPAAQTATGTLPPTTGTPSTEPLIDGVIYRAGIWLSAAQRIFEDDHGGPASGQPAPTPGASV